MARLFPANINQAPSGQLIIQNTHSLKQVFFIPPVEKIKEAGLNTQNPNQYQELILEISEKDNFIKIYPLKTYGDNKTFLKQKYLQIRTITLKGFNFSNINTEQDVMSILEELPNGFVKDYDYGLGLRKSYNFLINALETFDIKHLVIREIDPSLDIEEPLANIDKINQVCVLPYSAFEKIIKQIDTIARKANDVSSEIKKNTVHNTLVKFLNDLAYQEKIINDDDWEKLRGHTERPAKKRLAKVKAVSGDITEIAKEEPRVLIDLHSKIELVTLDRLIQQFENMLTKKLKESSWQKLFNDNPFILTLAFGYPIIKMQDQAHVGGRNLSGKGNKITDFLVKNGMSNNAALFEIKTPSTKLLNQNPYRGCLFTPSSDFSGAINQILDQKTKFEQEIAQIKHNSKISDLEAYSVQGVLIIGVMPENLEQKKSFELFRGNSKDIMILTFDELLGKLKLLRDFLTASEEKMKN